MSFSLLAFRDDLKGELLFVRESSNFVSETFDADLFVKVKAKTIFYISKSNKHIFGVWEESIEGRYNLVIRKYIWITFNCR